MSTEAKKAGWKPWFFLLGLPLLLELAEYVLDLWKGDGNGVIDKIDTPLTIYQLLSILLFLLWLASYFSARGRKAISKTVFFIAGFFFLLLVAEGIARIIYAFSGSEMSTVEGFRMSQPAPYRNAPYFSEEFVKESTGKLKWELPEGSSLILPVDFEGKYIHVRNKLRVTTNVPVHAAHRILLFGGSTVFCNEVPDSFTVASYLQRECELKMPGQYEVINYGVTSINAAQQWERLKSTILDSNDIVVFYDGVNDIFNTMYMNNPGGTILSDQQNKYESSKGFHFFYDIYNRFMMHSRLVALLFNPYKVQEPVHLKDASRMKILRLRLMNDYVRSLDYSRKYARSNGAQFLHFLQPDLYTEKTRSDYEKTMLSFFEYPGLEMAEKEGRPVLRNAIDYLNRTDTSSTDLSYIFEGSTNDVYLDFCHVAHEGNSIIAKHLFNTIEKRRIVK